MSTGTSHRRGIAKALTALLPGVPYLDAEAIREAAHRPHLKMLPPSTAVWLATVAYVRHLYTDYDALMAEGYDRDAARFFVVADVNAKLTEWRATRLLESEDDGETD